MFSLAQMGLRHNLASFLDLGPSRQMQGMMAQVSASPFEIDDGFLFDVASANHNSSLVLSP